MAAQAQAQARDARDIAIKTLELVCARLVPFSAEGELITKVLATTKQKTALGEIARREADMAGAEGILMERLRSTFKAGSVARHWFDAEYEAGRFDPVAANLNTLVAAQSTMDRVRAAFDARFLGSSIMAPLLSAMLGMRRESQQPPREFAEELTRLNAALGLQAFPNEALRARLVETSADLASGVQPGADWNQTVAVLQQAWELKSQQGSKATALVARGDTGEVVGQGQEGRCWLCDERGHRLHNCTNATCMLCGKKGHLARDCTNKKAKYPMTQHIRQKARVMAVTSSRAIGKRKWIAVKMGTKAVPALVDGGAECSIVGEDTLRGIEHKVVKSPWRAIAGLASAREVPVLFGARVWLRVGHCKEFEVEFAVVPSADTTEALILGADVLAHIGVIDAMIKALALAGAEAADSAEAAMGGRKRAEVGTAVSRRKEKKDIEGGEEDRAESLGTINNLNLSHLDDLPKERDRLRRALIQYRQVFIRKDCLPPFAKMPEVSFKVIGAPVIDAMRPWSQWAQKELARHEDKFVKYGHAKWVEKSEWRAEPVLAAKADNTSRYTIDNSRTGRSIAVDAYPMPRISEEMEKISGGTVFNKADFADGYRQRRVAEGSREITTARGTRGLLQFESMQMGMHPAAGLFNEGVRTYVVEKLCKESQVRTAQYVDDLAQSVKGARAKAVSEAITMWIEMLQVLANVRCSLRLEKCKFAEKSIVWCGTELSEGGLAMPPSRTRALLELGEPECKKDLQRLLGHAEAYRSAVPRLDEFMKPVRDCATRSKGKIKITTELLAACDELKIQCARAIMRATPDTAKMMTVVVDGSGTGYGATLEQDGRVLAVDSRVKRDEERHYSSLDTEWTAVAFGLETFKYFTDGSAIPIDVVSDHKDLEPIVMRVQEDSTGRRMRIVERLQRFKFNLRYAPRARVAAPDALSYDPRFRKAAAEFRKKQLKEAIRRLEEREAGKGATPAMAKATAASTVAERKRNDRGRRQRQRESRKRRKAEKQEKAAKAAGREETAKASAATMVATEPERKGPEWWKERQEKDKGVAKMIAIKQGKGGEAKDKDKDLRVLVAKAEQCVLIDGVLYHLHKPGVRSAKRDWVQQIVVPDVDGLRKEWLDRAHAKEGGHRAARKTFDRLLGMVWWETMYEDCEKWTRECLTCGYMKTFDKKRGALQPTTTKQLKGQRRVAMDLAGPLPLSNGCTHIVITVDADDGWVTITPTADLTAEGTIAVVKKEVIAQSGVPEVFLTDQGSNLVADVAQKFYESVGMKKRQSAPLAPWGDGAAEARVKAALWMIKSLLLALDLKDNWFSVVWLVEMTLRTEVFPPFGIIPFVARFGRSARTPAFFELPHTPEDDASTEEMRDIRERMRTLRDEYAIQMKKQFDKGITEVNFRVGDLVWMRNEDRKNKLERQRVGPFKIKQKIGEVTVELEDVQGATAKLGRRSKVQSVRNIAPYEAKEITKDKEYIVKEILAHRNKGRAREFHVLWDTGVSTWEKRSNLVDTINGEEIVNDALVKYYARNPRLGSKGVV